MSIGISEKQKKNIDDAARVADNGMDWIYFFANLYMMIHSNYELLRQGATILGPAWNMIDAIGAFALACQSAKNGDIEEAGWNMASASQLTICTFLSNAAGGLGFAAAMGISAIIEHRKIQKIDNELEKIFGMTKINRI